MTQKKKREENKEDTENESLSKALSDNIIQITECEKELIKSKQLGKDLRADAEQVCVEYEKFHNRSTRIEVRHEALVEELKDESCRVMFV